MATVRYRRSGSTLGVNIGSAVEALWANRLRSCLTALGIFIGVAAVIAALTLTQGVNAMVADQIAGLGNSIIVDPGMVNKGNGSQAASSPSTLTAEDSHALQGVAHVVAVSPVIMLSEQVVYGKENTMTTVEGVNTEYPGIQSVKLAQGSWFSGTNDANGESVAVLGDTVMHRLFDASKTNPIGQDIRIRNQIFRVVGVQAAQGGGFGPDDVIFIPLKATQIRLKNTTTVDEIQVKVDKIENVEETARAITSVLRQNHHLQQDGHDDFMVQTFTQLLQQVGQFENVLAFLFVGIALISLTVGGIGIMNIMLVSVTERKGEIGIRMSLGARRSDIRNQFLIEALCLCLISGVIGLLLGLLLGLGITAIFMLPFVITTTTLVVPFAVSATIAIVFGLYPAIRASHLDPIVAIRADEGGVDVEQVKVSRFRPERTTQVSNPVVEGTLVVAAEAVSLESLFEELRLREGKKGSLIGASVGSAFEAVKVNRVRSLLTLLGMIIGVAAVIGSLTLTQGVGTYFDNLILSEGVTTIAIQPGSAMQNGAVGTSKQQHPLSVQDLQSLSKLPHVRAISPVLFAGAQVVYGNQNYRRGRIQGVSADIQAIQNWQLAQGQWFSASQEAGGEPVAVIGDTIVQNLFAPSGTDPIGKQIRVGDQFFRVVGVLAVKGGFGLDRSIFIPYKAVEARLTNSSTFDEIDLSADSQSHVDLVVQEITMALELNHRIAQGSDDDFQTVTALQRLQESDRGTQAFKALLTGIAAISLTIAGIGIMNIMLVSVTERTREIGIRMSLGARRRDIRNQFLAEALFLCLLGGAIGLLVGTLVGWLMVGVLITAFTGGDANGGVPVMITPTTLLLPLAVSTIVGLIFGLYPAIRASRLDPVEALRRGK